MTQEQGNKIVAEFMGMRHRIENAFQEVEPFLQVDNKTGYWVEAKFHASLDWLHPVIKKIATEVINRDCKTGGEFRQMMDLWRPIAKAIEKVEDIDVLFPLVVAFIQWYNTLTSKDDKQQF